MKKWFLNIGVAIWCSTIILTLYSFLAASALTPMLVCWIFTLSPLVVLWLVFSVLMDKHQIEKTFDDYFYQDADMRRNTASKFSNDSIA
jgi:hypothetical protein